MQLRNAFGRLLVAPVVMWVIAGQLPAQQLTTETPAVIQKDTDLAKDSLLPQLPVNLCSRFAYNEADSNALGLTKQQRHDLRVFLQDLNAQRHPSSSLRHDLEQAKLGSHRFLLAIAEAQDEIDAQGRGQVQRYLTFEQRALARQKYRVELFQLSQYSTKPTISAHSFVAIDNYLAAEDLLSALLQPDVQQSLLITDDQWLKIEAAKKDAYPAARELTAMLIKERVPKSIAETPQRASLLEDLNRDSLAALTPDQVEKYDLLLKERQRKVSLATEKKDTVEVLRLSAFHGMPEQVLTQNADGVRIFRATAYNLFAEPELVERLALTEAQQQTIAKLVADFDLAVLRAHNEYQAAEHSKSAERQKRLRDLILPHNRQFQMRLANLLTSEQQESLVKVKWRGLGLAALLRPEIAEKLQLTDQQKAAIDAQFKLPSPQMKFPTKPGDVEEFRKNSEEFHKKVREHSTALTANIWAQLTPDQVDRFEKLTGQRPPPIPATPAGN